LRPAQALFWEAFSADVGESVMAFWLELELELSTPIN
jgi:hypothetical protein